MAEAVEGWAALYGPAGQGDVSRHQGRDERNKDGSLTNTGRQHKNNDFGVVRDISVNKSIVVVRDITDIKDIMVN